MEIVFVMLFWVLVIGAIVAVKSKQSEERKELLKSNPEAYARVLEAEQASKRARSELGSTALKAAAIFLRK